MEFYKENPEYNNNVLAISEEGYRVTYSDLSMFTKKIEELFIEKRALIFIFCSNQIGALFGYVSSLRLGYIPLLLNENMDPLLAVHLFEIYQPQYVYLSKDDKGIVPDLPVILEDYGFLLLKTGYEKPVQKNKELALLLTTSGSTGSPKLVRQSYRNIQSNAEAIATYLGITAEERPITTLPMNYTYGLSIINSHLYRGATILLTNKALVEREFWEFFEREKATSFGGVPYTYETLDKFRFFQRKLPSLHIMTQAGGKLSPELHKKFAEFAVEQKKQFVVMYGQTEATARMAYLPADRSLEKYGSMGIAIPGGQFTLIDTEEREIEESDQIGELVYHGPNVTLGYAECKEDLNRGDERQGILLTGDMAKRDKDGFYYIVGRKKRFLKIFGNRVNLDEAEMLVKEQFPEIDCACTGKDDELVLFISQKSNNTDKEPSLVSSESPSHTSIADEKESSFLSLVKSYIAGKLGLHPLAFYVRWIDAIPKNDAGKTLYAKLDYEHPLTK